MNLHLCIAKSFADRKQKKGGKREEKEKERKGKGKLVTCLDHPRDKRGADRARTN